MGSDTVSRWMVSELNELLDTQLVSGDCLVQEENTHTGTKCEIVAPLDPGFLREELTCYLATALPDCVFTCSLPLTGSFCDLQLFA